MRLARLSFVLPVVLIVVFALAMPAAADAPALWGEGPFTVDEDWGSCTRFNEQYDFNLMRHAEGWSKAVGYFDKDGTLIRILMHDTALSSFYNSAYPDYKISGPSNIVWNFRIEDGQWHVWYSGVFFNVSVQGEGTVIHESGRTELLFDTWELLKQNGNVTYDVATMCRLLAR